MKNSLLETWVNQFTEDLFRWAYYKTSSTEVAEDLVQETFLAAAATIENFKGGSSAKTWLFAILNHKIIDFYRKKVNQPLTVESDSLANFFDENGSWRQEKRPADWNDDENHLLDDPDFQQILKKCMDALPEKWSACVKQKYLSEQSGEEICQELGLTPTNLWQILHRAKLQLRSCVENKWFKN